MKVLKLILGKMLSVT